MRHEKATVLIIGGGVIGSALAMHLARLGVSGVRVVDPDLEGPLSSSELNAGGVRATMEHPLNIALSKRSIEYFETVADEVGFRACGYLWLRSPGAMEAAERSARRQLAAGWPVETLGPEEIRSRWGFLDRLDGVVGAHFGRRDGLINPNLLKLHFRAEARKAGAVFDDRTWVRGCVRAGAGLEVQCSRWAAEDPQGEELRRAGLLAEHGPAAPGADNSINLVYDADRVVNCAGPWAPRVAEALGYFCPSQPLRRMIALFESREVDLSPYGMIVDTSGVYFHPEATFGLAGVATPERPGIDFSYPGESFFEEWIWPALYERSSGFERLRHRTGWAGLYEVSPDHSAIVGPVASAQTGSSGFSERIFEAHSFSGHGVMQSYAVGLALAERIVLGRYESCDLGPLAGSRFGAAGVEDAGDRSRWVVEGAVI
jgi:sarcosine oxidase subunit beta